MCIGWVVVSKEDSVDLCIRDDGNDCDDIDIDGNSDFDAFQKGKDVEDVANVVVVKSWFLFWVIVDTVTTGLLPVTDLCSPMVVNVTLCSVCMELNMML